MQRIMRRVAVIGGVRIPFCRSNTFYADLSNLEMMTGALNALVNRYKLKGQHIDEIVGGAVVTHSKDFNLTREAVLGTTLAASTPGITMMQACGTSLQGGLGSAAKIATGEIECAISVGSDTTSDAPIVISRKLAQTWAVSTSFSISVAHLTGAWGSRTRRAETAIRSRLYVGYPWRVNGSVALL